MITTGPGDQHALERPCGLADHNNVYLNMVSRCYRPSFLRGVGTHTSRAKEGKELWLSLAFCVRHTNVYAIPTPRTLNYFFDILTRARHRGGSHASKSLVCHVQSIPNSFGEKTVVVGIARISLIRGNAPVCNRKLRPRQRWTPTPIGIQTHAAQPRPDSRPRRS